MNTKLFPLLIFFIIKNACLLLAQTQCDILISNVAVVDVKNSKLNKNVDVAIAGNKIIAITANGDKKYNAKTKIDGKGKFLIPGLWDMHTHNWWNIHFSDMYVTNGVLGVRNMYTPMSAINPLKDSISKGLIQGPKYYAAGRVIEGPKPSFPDWLVVDSLHKIKPALDTLQIEGSDFVKVYNKIPKEVYFELIKEARQRGMSVQGHLPMSVTAIEASNAGQKSFEHMLGIPDMCTKHSLFEKKYNYNWFAAVMNEDDYGTVTINDSLASATFSVLKKNKTYVCPTLVVWYSYFHPDTLFENDTLLKKLPADVSEYWKVSLDKYRKKDSAYKQMAFKKYETLKKTTYLLYKSGVPLLTGTDAINPYCYPGYSLHREFILLKECGIPDAEILKMATVNAADFFGLKEYGQISEGAIASVVLLNGNPLLNIANTIKINTVVLNGQLLKK